MTDSGVTGPGDSQVLASLSSLRETAGAARAWEGDWVSAAPGHPLEAGGRGSVPGMSQACLPQVLAGQPTSLAEQAAATGFWALCGSVN